MADAVEVLDHRDARLVGDALDQALAPARHDHVDVLAHGDELADRCAIRGRDDLYRALRQTGDTQAFMHAGGDRLVRTQGFRAAAQDARIAGLQAQAGSVGGDVGPRFVDDPDHPERDAHATDLDPGRTLLEIAHAPDRIGQRRNLLQALGHRPDPLRRQHEAVEHGGFEPACTRVGHVARVGFEQGGAVAADGRGDGEQRCVLRCRAGARHLARSAARLTSHGGHVGLDVDDR